MKDFKDSRELREKLNQLVTVLNSAQSQKNENNAFFANLTEVSENLDFIQKQVDKYTKANAIKKKAIESKVRHKLRGVQYSISF